MTVICPTVTAENEHQYRDQVERIAGFASRVHLDFMDGTLTETVSPSLGKAWWPHNVNADLHLMYSRPSEYLKAVIALKPRLVIVHAEAEGNFTEIADALHQAGIKAGVALLKDTPVSKIAPSLNLIDHVLIFSGDLGRFGGSVDFALLDKATELRKLKNDLEIGWDGGITDANIRRLVEGGVNVLNVGGFIQRDEDPKSRFEALQNLLQ